MPSVIATWNGSSPDEESCEELFARMKELGELSHSYLQKPEEVQIFNQWVEGDILLAERDEPTIGGISLHVPLLQPPRKKRARRAGKLRRAHLEGVQFHLFDPRNSYPYENRISFVFARTDADQKTRPLVAVESGTDLAAYEDESLQSATLVLTEPSIHLRYYCEEWIDLLLAWVKHYCIPELYYWRHRPYPGVERFEGRDSSDVNARDADWRVVVEEFKKEVEQWWSGDYRGGL